MEYCSYEITVLGWEKHNEKNRKSYTHFLLSRSLFNDHKITQLSAIEFQLYIYLLTVCADIGRSSYTLSTHMIPSCITIRTQRLHTCITRLQELQLVTIEKSPLKEKKLKEIKIKEKKVSADVKNESEKSISTQVNKVALRGCIPEFSFDEICNEFLKDVTHSAQNAWLSAYPSVDWIVHEVRKANAWCETNPHKKPKNVGKFMLNWLNNGFESYRKSLQSKTSAYDPNAALLEKFKRESQK